VVFQKGPMTFGCSAEIEILRIADLEETTRFGIMGPSNYMSV